MLSDREEEDEEEEEEGVEAAEQRRQVSGWAGQGLGTTVELGEGKEARRTRGWSWRNPPLRLVFQAKQISPELSALVVYCCATRLRTLCPAPASAQPCQVSSLSERKAKKITREEGRTSGVWGQEGSGACRLLVGAYPEVGLERRLRGLWGQ